MQFLRCVAAPALLAMVTGCANLKTVRDFAGESARFAANTELATRFRDTCRREQPYVSDEAASAARANDQKRKSAYPDLVKIHRSVAAYMRTLAALAGDKTFDLSKDLESLASGIEAHPDFGVAAEQVEACSDLSKVTAKWITSARQQKAVREMLKEGDPPLRIMLDGMTALVRHYRKTNENERRSVIGLLEVEIPFADTPQDLLLATLAKAHLQSKQREYEQADALYEDAEKGLQRMREGHAKLLEQAGDLSGEEARTLVGALTKDLKTMSDNLQTIHAW